MTKLDTAHIPSTTTEEVDPVTRDVDKAVRNMELEGFEVSSDSIARIREEVQAARDADALESSLEYFFSRDERAAEGLPESNPLDSLSFARSK